MSGGVNVNWLRAIALQMLYGNLSEFLFWNFSVYTFGDLNLSRNFNFVCRYFNLILFVTPILIGWKISIKFVWSTFPSERIAF